MKTDKELTEDEKRIKIAEHLGWTDMSSQNHQVTDATFPYGRPPTGEFYSVPPDYFHDLNAMHEAECGINENCQAIYEAELYRVCGVNPQTIFAKDTFKMFCATAAQRAEAFGKALNLW